MPNVLNITNIPAPRVEFIDPRTGLMSREWYRFFLNLFVLTGSGANPTSLEDLQLDSPTASEIASLEEKVYALTQDAKTQLGETKAQEALDLYSSLINSVGLASLGPAIDYTTPKIIDNTDLLVLAPAPRYDNSIDTNLIDFEQSVPHVGAVARMVWNDADGTLDLGLKGGNVTLQIGQEQVVRVVNKSGADLTDGQVVYLSGAQGNRVKVDLAVANGSTSLARTVLGLVTEPILNNQEGFVTISGLVRGLNTSAFTDGDVLYLSTTPGAITNVKPTPPVHAVIVGFCVNANPAVGSILVSVSPGYDLEDLSDVSITTPANNDLIRYDAATQVWKNTATGTGVLTALGINVGSTGAFIVNGGTGTISSLLVEDGTITTGRYASQSASLFFRSAAGTQAAPTAIAGATTLGSLTTRGYDGAAYRDVTSIFSASDGAISSTSSPGFMFFSTTQSGTVTPRERMRIDSAGNINVGASNTTAAGSLRFFDVYNTETTSAVSGVDIRLITRNVANTANVTVDLVKYKNGSFGINNNETDVNAYTSFGVGGVERFRVTGNGSVLLKSAGGLGYGTGSGGAVTQLISRATGVTLDKTNGAITMFSAAGSATAATFTVTNSTVVATDTIVLSVKSSTNVYLMFVTAVAAGSFNITFQTTGGTAVDAPVINYAVIKAVIA